ncbi:MAG TPA: hypothetical protein DDW52_05980 [Planctomycetaceae bacterium]|nr:hypothetical protein [Planctomycetaceae bacterium]
MTSVSQRSYLARRCCRASEPTNTASTDRARSPSTGWYTWLLLAVLVGGAQIGCDRTSEIVQQQKSNKSTNAQEDESPRRFVSTQRSVVQILNDTTAAYAQAGAYQDQAYVRLLYTLEGKPVEDRAPLQIAMHRSSGDRRPAFSARVYSTQSGVSGSRWHLASENFSAASATNLAAQAPFIISRHLPERLSLEWLNQCPAVTGELSAGLAGFPLQLRLLLSDRENQPTAMLGTPLQQLQDQGELRSPDSIEGRPCEVIVAGQGGESTAVWIDKQDRIIRRLKLPNAVLPPEMRSDKRVADIQLTVEFAKASFAAPTRTQLTAPELDSTHRRLTQYVQAPPLVDDSLLNEQLPAFSLRSPSGALAVDSERSNRAGKILVLVWLANHPAANLAAEQLHAAERNLFSENPQLHQQVEFVSVWAEPTPPSGTTFESLKADWYLPGTVVVDRRALGRDLFRVQEAPTVVILDAENRLQWKAIRSRPDLTDAVASAVQQIAAGRNLAKESLHRIETAQRRYHAELEMFAAVDNPAGPIAVEPYLPTWFRLKQVRRRNISDGAVALATDSASDTRGTWLLTEDAVAIPVGASTPPPTIPDSSTRDVRFDKVGSSTPLFAVRGDYLAVATDRRLSLRDGRSQANQQGGARALRFDRDFDSQILHIAWLESPQRTPRIAVLTLKKLLVLEPTTGAVLSAELPEEPTALTGGATPTVLYRSGRIAPIALDGTEAVAADAKLPLRPLRWWQPYKTSQGSGLIGCAVVGEQQPALMILDSQRRPLWHTELPSSWRIEQTGLFTVHEYNGHIVAAVASPEGGVQLFRTSLPDLNVAAPAVDVISDHCKLPHRIDAISLGTENPTDGKLHLRIVAAQRLLDYELDW